MNTGTMHFHEFGEYPPLETRIPREALRLVTLPKIHKRELIRLLSLERVTKAHLMPTLDNVTDELKHVRAEMARQKQVSIEPTQGGVGHTATDR